MIVPKQIIWKNFMSYGDQNVIFDLNEGITLVNGHNGSGKSTLLDAICYVLYGKPFRKVKLGNLINSINNKSMEVTISFTKGKDNWRIIRGQKPSKFEIYKDDKKLDSEAGKKNQQNFLEENILGINYQAFNQIVILGSATYSPFMRLTTGARRVVIEELLNLNIFSEMKEQLKILKSKNRSEENENSHEISKFEDSLNNHKKFLEVAERQEKKLTDGIEETISRLSKELNEGNDKIKLVELSVKKVFPYFEKYKKIDYDIDDQNKIKRSLESEIKRYNNELVGLDEDPICSKCGQDLPKKDFSKLKIDLGEQIKHLEKKFIISDEKISKWNDSLQKLGPYYEKYNELISKVAYLGGVISSIESSINSEEIKLKEAKKSKGRDDSEISKLENKISNIEVQIGNLSVIKNVISKRRNSIQYYDIILSDKGVKKYVIDKFIPLMNQLINKYLEELGLSISFHLDGKFDETIKSRYRDDFSYESFSEGEKLRIDLSLLFAWREIARMRNSSNFPLLIFDEITDRSLDYDGQMAFLGFLKKIKGSIVIISHNDSIKDSCRNIIEVKKIGNFSQHV